MDRQAVWDELGEVFREVFEDADLEVGSATTAKDVEGWDSLAHIQLLVAVEKAFGMRFNTGEVAGLANVGEMVELIARRTNATK